jgi:hypothetical protein
MTRDNLYIKSTRIRSLARSLPIADMSAITARVQAFTHVLDKHGMAEKPMSQKPWFYLNFEG